jgi:uncharacterized protein (DUF4415 family)
MKKYTGPNGEKMVSMKLDEEVSPERQAEIDALKAEYRARNPFGEIDTSDIPDMADDDEFWENATIGWPPPKKVHVTLRLDEDIIEYFKTHPNASRGYQTRINWVLRSYVAAQMKAEAAAQEKERA